MLLRSLSIVFGTPITLTPSESSLVATPNVSSPPMAMSASIPALAKFSLIFSTPPSILNGFVRDDPRIVPPRGKIPRVVSRVRGMVKPSSGPFQPSRKPMNSCPYSLTPFRTTARITAFNPGQSPPPVSTPIRIINSIKKSFMKKGSNFQIALPMVNADVHSLAFRHG